MRNLATRLSSLNRCRQVLLFATLALIACCSRAPSILLAEQPEPNQVEQLPISDDFSAALANRYETSGAIKQTQSGVRLEKGGKLFRRASVGPSCELSIECKPEVPQDAGAVSEFHFGGTCIDGSIGLVAFILARRDGMLHAEVVIAVILVDEQGNRSLHAVRRFSRPLDDRLNGLWRLRYHYGLIELFQGDQRVAVGDVARGNLPMAGFYLAQEAGACQLSTARFSGLPPEPVESKDRLQARQKILEQYREATQAAFEELRQGRPAKALQHAQQGVSLAEQIWGKGHLSCLDAIGLVATCHEFAGRHDLAFDLHQQIHKSQSEQLGSIHPTTARAQRSLGLCLRGMKRLGDAHAALERAAVAFDEVLGPAHEDTAFTWLNLARVCQDEKQFGLAQRYFERAILSYEQTFGAEAANVILPLEHLADLLKLVGDVSSARKHLARAAAISAKTEGAQAERTVRLQDSLQRLSPPAHLTPESPLKSNPPPKRSQTQRHEATKPFASVESELFQSDPKNKYVVTGDVAWQPGSLTLKSDGFLSWQDDHGMCFQTSTQISHVKADSKGKWRAKWGLIVGRSPVEIELNCQLDDRLPRGTVQVSNTSTGNQVRTLRTFATTSVPKGKWSVIFNHGLIEISHEGQDIGAAWAVEMTNMPAAGLYFSQEIGESQYTSFEVSKSATATSEVDLTALPDDALQQLQTLNIQSGQLCKPGTLQQSFEFAKRGSSLCRKYLGDSSDFTVAFESKMASATELMGRARETIAVREAIASVAHERFGERHPQHALYRRDVAMAFSMAGQAESAIAILDTVLPVLERTLGPLDREYLRTELQLSNVLNSTKRLSEAPTHLAICLEGMKALEGEKSQSLCIPLEAWAAFDGYSGRYQEAVSRLHESLAIRTAVQGATHPEALEARRQIARSIAYQGDYLAARRIFEVLLRELEGVKAAAIEIALTRVELAKLLSEHDDQELAFQLIESALSQLEQEPIGDTPAVVQRRGRIMMDFGAALDRHGDYARAIEMYRRAGETMETGFGKEHPIAIDCGIQVASLHARLGHAADAITAFQDVLARQQRALGKDNSNSILTLKALGNAETLQGNLVAARKTLQMAFDLSMRLHGEQNGTTALLAHELASVCAGLEDEKEARRLSTISLSTLQSLYGASHPILAQQNEYAAGIAVTLGDWKTAERHYRGALEIYLDLCERELQGLPEAQALRYVARMQQCRNSYLSLCAAVHQNGAALAARLDSLPDLSTADVYRSVWRSRAIASRSIAKQASQGESAKHAELSSIRAQIASLTFAPPANMPSAVWRSRIQHLTQQKEKLQSELASGSPFDAKASETPRFEDVIRRLGSQAALVDFVCPYDSHSFTSNEAQRQAAEYECFVIRAQAAAPGYRLEWLHCGPAKPIDAQITILRSAVGGRAYVLDQQRPPNTAAWRQASAQLGALVWNKIAPHLEGCNTAIVVPDGSLTFAPWYALPGKQPGTFVIDDIAVGTVLHGQQIGELLDRPAVEGHRLLLAGDIDYGKPAVGEPARWKELTGTGEEVTAIEELWKSRGPVVRLAGRDATKTVLQTAFVDARYIHLATHGAFADAKFRSLLNSHGLGFAPTGGLQNGMEFDPLLRNPLTLSGIVLAGANLARDDQGLLPSSECVLTGDEIDGSDLKNAELVVLSACETGVGELVASEGAFSLQRAFHLAGARSVIASLWKVDDAATRTLMKLFYRNLWEQKQGRLEALRNAQATMLRRYDYRNSRLRPPGDTSEAEMLPPHYWAAFVLSGDWR